MQKIIDNEFYISKEDLRFLLQEMMEIIPIDILKELLDLYKRSHSTGYLKIEKLRIIEFITELDFVYDEDIVSYFSVNELSDELNNLVAKIVRVDGKIFADSLKGKVNRNDQLLSKCLTYKLKSLKNKGGIV